MASLPQLNLSNIIFWITQKRWIIIALLVGIILYNVPTPSGLTDAGYHTLIIIIITLILIITEPIPLPGVAFLIIILEVYFGVADADSVAKSFMNDAVFFIMGSLTLAVAIVRQGWDTRIALMIIKFTGNNAYRIAFGFAFIAAILSSFIGEHTVVAILLPIGVTLLRFSAKDIKKIRNLSALILFSIAYGSLIGSIGTPSGGGRNVIMLSYWKSFGLSGLSYVEWMYLVYPLILIQLPIFMWISVKTFKPEKLLLDSGVRRLKAQVARSEMQPAKNIAALIIFFLVFLGWIFYSEEIGLGIIALTGVILYLVSGLVTWDDINRNVNWGVIILFGATLSLGAQIYNTGAATWLADKILLLTGQIMESIPILTDTFVVLITTILANIISSSATVAVLAPITLKLSGDPIYLGLLTAIASAFGYFTAVAAPACTIIYASGLIKAKDFLKIGWKMGLVSIITVIVYANVYWKIINM